MSQRPVISLNAEQRDAVVSDEHLLCVACPGSGKTRVLIEKARHTLESRPDSHIILTTFSRDAAQEIRDRIAAQLGKADRRRLTVGTFHALALSQLRRAQALAKILGEVETDHLVRRALAETGSKVPIEEAEERIARCKMDAAYAKSDPEAAELGRAYDSLLNLAGACDFTDIMLRCVSMMDKGQVTPMRATHIFCDEFQDIDRIQFEWLRRHLATGMNACAVGDDDQSVFGFRRALGYRGMMEFAELTGARLVTLTVNYRSTAGILSSAGQLISQNVDRVPKALKAARGDGPKPIVKVFDEPEDQAEMIVVDLDRLCRDNPHPHQAEAGWRFAVREGQAAVLARTNQNLSDIEPVFIKRRVPYIRTGRGIWKTPEGQSMVSLLSALDTGRDIGLEVALRWAGASDAVRDALIERGGGSLWGLVDSVAHAELPGGPMAANFVRSVHNWRALLDSGQIGQAIRGVCDWMAAQAQRNAKEGAAEQAARSVRRLEGMRDILSDCFEGSLAQRISTTRRESRDEMPRVVLSTFHAAKGLEWDHVYLTDVVGGLVPKINDGAGDAALEEERRVFYVAMTRARTSLTVFTSAKRPSEFLAEAGI